MEEEDASYLTDGFVPRFATEKAKPSYRDESDYSTLLNLKKFLESYMNALRSDFNAFSNLDADPDIAAKSLLFEVAVNQRVYILLSTMVNQINYSIDGIDINSKP